MQAKLPAHRLAAIARDPRSYQIAVLSALLLYGKTVLDFRIAWTVIAQILGACLILQWAATRLWSLPRFEPRSALISALSLCLLLRTTSTAWLAAACAVAILGKFCIRVRTKHIFNPTNLGLGATMLMTDAVWVSPGQWGSAALSAFAFACVGGLVIFRARRSDVTYAFLACYGALVFGRAWWLGDPMAIPIHHLSSGAFLLFAFFMISDPRATPNSRAGRIVFAALVALGAGYVHFVLFRPNGLIWSLFFLAPLVPLLDRLLPGEEYQWQSNSNSKAISGGNHETRPLLVSVPGRP